MSVRMLITGIPVNRASGRKVARHTKKKLRKAKAMDPNRAKAMSRASDARKGDAATQDAYDQRVYDKLGRGR